MSQLNILGGNQLLARVLKNLTNSREKCFSTLNAHGRCANRFARNQRKSVNFVSVVQRAGVSNLAGPITEDYVLSSPFGEVTSPELPLTEYIFEHHEKYEDLPAITCGTSGRSYSYGMCRAMITRCAKAYLTALHLQPGDMVGLVLPNIPEFVVVLNGALEAGLMVTFANPLYTEEEITRQFLDSKVKCIVTIEQLMPVSLAVRKNLGPDYKGTIWIGGDEAEKDGVYGLKPLLMADYQADLPKIDVNDVALVPYSSGTTGLPKGVMLTHKNLVTNLEQVVNKCFSKPNRENGNHDTILTVPPFFHIYGFNGILNYNLRIGNNVLTIPRFTPEEYLKCLREHRPTSLFVVPSLLSLLATHPMVATDDLSSVGEIVIGAAPTTESTLEKFLNKCGKTRDEMKLQQGFGMTESSPVATLTPFKYPNSKLVSVGQLVPGTKAKVISLTKNTNLGPNSPGELLVKGPQIMKGYLNNEAATKETVDEDGWLHTGDVAYYDEDHYFFIVDRTKELIKVKGNQVSPSELENVIMEMPAIADAAVVGVPDHLAGEIPRAFVVLKKDHKVKPEEIAEFVAKKVVKYKHLVGGVYIIDSIPRNPGGKIMRNQLKILGKK